jgi:hypothetical protein
VELRGRRTARRSPSSPMSPARCRRSSSSISDGSRTDAEPASTPR